MNNSISPDYFFKTRYSESASKLLPDAEKIVKLVTFRDTGAVDKPPESKWAPSSIDKRDWPEKIPRATTDWAW